MSEFPISKSGKDKSSIGQFMFKKVGLQEIGRSNKHGSFHKELPPPVILHPLEFDELTLARSSEVITCRMRAKRRTKVRVKQE